MSYVFSFLSCIAAPVPVEDLENLLHESMLLTFNTEIEDGSIEQVEPQFGSYVHIVLLTLVLTFSIKKTLLLTLLPSI